MVNILILGVALVVNVMLFFCSPSLFLLSKVMLIVSLLPGLITNVAFMKEQIK